MQALTKFLILTFQILALTAIKLNFVDGTSSSLDIPEKPDVVQLKATEINYPKPDLETDLLDSDLIDIYDQEKRAQWNNLQGAWGKRAEWNKLSAAWGKRPAGGAAGGAAGWNNLSGMWGKRAKWNELSGMWGKRGWNDMSGGWGKRNSPHWNKLRGMWGKRSVSLKQAFPAKP